MTSFDMKDIKKDLYEAALITAGAAAAGFLFRKATGSSLSTPETLKGTLKFGVAVGLGVVGVKFLQMKKWVPVDPKV